jgi:hypothetical protein
LVHATRSVGVNIPRLHITNQLQTSKYHETIGMADDPGSEHALILGGTTSGPTMATSGVKRDHDGNAKSRDMRPEPEEAVRSPFVPMFEYFRDELDEHHARRDRIGKVSRDVTALSKKMFGFSFHGVF